MRICHVTTAHPWDDSRIFTRMCCGLADRGYDVSLVADVPGPGTREGVRLVPTGLKGKRDRLFGFPRMVPRLRELQADVYHFHDPELLPWMFLFRKQLAPGAVVYDVHEYYAETLVDSNYFGNRGLNLLMAGIVKHVEPLMARRLRGVIGVTEPIARRFRGGGAHVGVVRNLVSLSRCGEGLPSVEAPAHPRIVLGGSIDQTRQMRELVQALGVLRSRGVRLDLLCVGKPHPAEFGDTLRELARQSGVGEQLEFRARLPFEEYQRCVATGCVGPVFYAPTINNSMGVPNRLYEYMAGGLPVVASDFPLVAEVVRDAECGLLVDTARPEAIADALEWLLAHPEEARRMGENGRRAVNDRYCWERELDVLESYYRELLAPKTGAVSGSGRTRAT